MYLTEDELQKPHSCKCFLEWVENTVASISDSTAGKNAIRFRKGVVKQLIEEVMPVAIFAEHHFGHTDEVVIQCVIGNQKYDAQVFDNRSYEPKLSYIEATQAHDGENEISRMRKLVECGQVSAVGSVCKKGTKATGIKVVVNSEAVSRRDTLDLTFVRCKEAIERKAGMTYPENTALVVVFDDYLLDEQGFDASALKTRIRPLVAKLKNFRLVSLVGWSKRTYIEFSLYG